MFFLCVYYVRLFSKTAWNPNPNPTTLMVKRHVGHFCNHFLWPLCSVQFWNPTDGHTMKRALQKVKKEAKLQVYEEREQMRKRERRLALCSAPVELSDSMTCSAQQHSWALCLCPIYSLAHPAPALWQPYHGAGRVTWAEEVHHQTHLQHSGQ